LVRWIALAAVLTPLAMSHALDAPAQAVLGAGAVLLFVSAFFWPRCPHCRTRIVQFSKRKWLPGLTCWHCGRPYDEDRCPPHLARLLEAVEQAAKVRKTDPAAADRLDADAEAEFAAASGRERAGLRERAPFDRAAALRLRTRLEEDLKALDRVRKTLLKSAESDSQAGAGLQNLEAAQRPIREEIASLNLTLQRLAARRSDQGGGLTSA